LGDDVDVVRDWERARAGATKTRAKRDARAKRGAREGVRVYNDAYTPTVTDV